MAPPNLPVAHGGRLVDLFATADECARLQQAAHEWPSWDVTDRQLCDLELLLNGGFSPLRGFMNRGDYDSVCSRMRLGDGTLWPIPITLDVPAELAGRLQCGNWLALRDPEGVLLAALEVDEVYAIDRLAEAKTVFGTVDGKHPAVDHLLHRSHPFAVGGRVTGLRPPVHHDFTALRHSPQQLRAEFARRGWQRIVAFQTRNPMHRAHWELTLRAARAIEGKLLIHPSTGMTKPGDVDHYTRTRCYQLVLAHYPADTALLSLLPLAMRMGGPREAMLHAIVRKNHGCTHLIVGRDHAGPGKDSSGRPFYGPYDAQALLARHERELGIAIVPFQAVVYVAGEDRYLPQDEVPAGARTLDVSGTELRELLATGREIPGWFTFPEVAAELRRTHPPRARQGVTVFFTGLSGAGKSTIANVLLVKLLERGGRPVTLLDGDLVRKHLSSELGFSKEHRDLNIRRIGFVAAEVTKNGGIAICAPIAPYDRTRKDVRASVQGAGGFVLVYLSTSLEVCESRDRKGLYQKARKGLIAQFTGISDPYEEPTDAELTIDTASVSQEDAAGRILQHLVQQGYLAPE
jgi:sulfate adenylyltransferase